jgi:hypothetical protein
MTETAVETHSAESAVATRTFEQRKEALATAVANSVRDGWGVQSQTDFQAVLVKGSKPNHVLHLLLTLLTLGLWAIVWVVVAFIGGEKHRVIQVDEYGNVNVQG